VDKKFLQSVGGLCKDIQMELKLFPIRTLEEMSKKMSSQGQMEVKEQSCKRENGSTTTIRQFVSRNYSKNYYKKNGYVKKCWFLRSQVEPGRQEGR